MPSIGDQLLDESDRLRRMSEGIDCGTAEGAELSRNLRLSSRRIASIAWDLTRAIQMHSTIVRVIAGELSQE